VAAFGYARNELGATAEIVKKEALSGKPLLGICVGHQLLFDESCELGSHQGLGLIKGKVVAIPPGRVIPHMGWNEVELPEDMDLFAGLPKKKHFYFAHSFYAQVCDPEAKITYCDYDGVKLTASVQKKNIFGVQFHPEKSSTFGLAILKNFVEICERLDDAC
jgi:glutamine amidotransferase